MNNMTPEQKKRQFRRLAKQDRIRTARELAEKLEQPLGFGEQRSKMRSSAFCSVAPQTP